MNRALIRKCSREAIVLLTACALAAGAFAWFRVWIVSEIDAMRFKQIVDLLPADWRRFASVDFDWLISYTGRTALTLDEPMLVMIVAIWAIVRGSDVVSGELNRGTLELLLAQPLSRRQVYWTQVVVTLVGVTILSAIIWAGMWLGVQTAAVKESAYPAIRVPLTDYHIPLTFLPPRETVLPMRERVDPSVYCPGVLALWGLGVFLAGVTSLLSAMDRYRWRTLGLAVGLYMLSAMLKILAMSSDRFAWACYLSFFTLYEPEAAIQAAHQTPAKVWSLASVDSMTQASLGFGGQFAALCTLGLIGLVLGSIIFSRRDIPT